MIEQTSIISLIGIFIGISSLIMVISKFASDSSFMMLSGAIVGALVGTLIVETIIGLIIGMIIGAIIAVVFFSHDSRDWRGDDGGGRHDDDGGTGVVRMVVLVLSVLSGVFILFMCVIVAILVLLGPVVGNVFSNTISTPVP